MPLIKGPFGPFFSSEIQLFKPNFFSRQIVKNQQQESITTKTLNLTFVLAADRAARAKNRCWQQENKDKQEVEYNKIRETIKYLGDENTELNLKLEQQVNALKDKLTAYRLRFDYAQKQLTKFSK